MLISKDILQRRRKVLELEASVRFKTSEPLNRYMEIVGKDFKDMTENELALYKIAFLIGQMFENEKTEHYADGLNHNTFLG